MGVPGHSSDEPEAVDRLKAPAGIAASWRLRRRIQQMGAERSRSSLTDSELGVLSQNGEDGVIQELLRRVGVRSEYFVEFGTGSGEQGNCVLLADHYGWNGLFIESAAEDYSRLERKYRSNPRITTLRALVTPTTIEPLLRDAGVPPGFDLLSIDIDGNDFWVWQAMRSFKPRVVVIEYNANLALESQVVMPHDDRHAWDGTDYFGASLGAYRRLASEKGYAFVHTERTGTNAFFVSRDERDAVATFAEPPTHTANYFCRGIRLPRDPHRRLFRDLTTGRLIDADR